MAKLYFRYGAMGSSKSANILMVRYNYEERGQYAVLLKPRTDNRDGEHEIQSRIGLAAPAEYVDDFMKKISELWDTREAEYLYHGKKVNAILVDEAQFLSPEEVDTLSDIVDFYEIPVLCYGLRILCILFFEPLCNLYEIPAGVLRGTGHSLYPAVATIIGTCCFRIVWICTVFRHYHQLNILYYAFPISWVLTIILITIGFIAKKPDKTF